MKKGTSLRSRAGSASSRECVTFFKLSEYCLGKGVCCNSHGMRMDGVDDALECSSLKTLQIAKAAAWADPSGTEGTVGKVQ